MGKQIARHNDEGVGTCTGHGSPIPMQGKIIATASIVYCDDLQVALEGDIVLGDCGHTGVCIASTNILEAEGKRVVRLGDSFVGTFYGTIVTGSPKTDSE